MSNAERPEVGGGQGASDGPSAGRRMIWWVIWTGAFLVGIVAVIIVLQVVGGGGPSSRPQTRSGPADDVDRDDRLSDLLSRTGWDDPIVGEIPPVEDDRVRSWLKGQGSPAVTLVDGTEDLWLIGAERCRSTVETLESVGSPDEMLTAAAGIPDGPTSEILVNLYSSTVRTLGACDDPVAFEDAVAEFAWHWVVADRRLEQIGLGR